MSGANKDLAFLGYVIPFPFFSSFSVCLGLAADSSVLFMYLFWELTLFLGAFIGIHSNGSRFLRRRSKAQVPASLVLLLRSYISFGASSSFYATYTNIETIRDETSRRQYGSCRLGFVTYAGSGQWITTFGVFV